MSRRRSPVVGKRYPLRTVCAVWRVPRSSVYARTTQPASVPAEAKRGPKTAQSDAELVTLIRAILATSPLHSEGHRKVRVRLRQRGVRIGKARVLRLMRVHGLLAPTRPGHVHGDPICSGVNLLVRIASVPPRFGDRFEALYERRGGSGKGERTNR